MIFDRRHSSIDRSIAFAHRRCRGNALDRLPHVLGYVMTWVIGKVEVIPCTLLCCMLFAEDASTAIYWGAYEEGPNTYDFYYGPPGFWSSAPWGNTGNTMDRFNSDAGKQVSMLHYGQPPPWDQTVFYGSVMDIAWNRGAVPLLSMGLGSATLADLSRGAEDAKILTWAAAVKSYGKPFLLRFAWEMNGNWFPWGQQPVAYIAAWRHFHDVVVSAGATNVTWLWCPNLINGPYPLAAYYPGDAYVDWMGLDGYNKGTSSTGFASLFKPSYDQLHAISSSKPIAIAEISSAEYAAGVKGAWITDLLGTQLRNSFPQIKAIVWFNWRIHESGQDWPWPIESSATAQSAFHDSIANSHYLAGGRLSLPTPLTKVRIPGITLGAINHAPVANAQSVTTSEDTAKAITLVATDVDGNALTYLIVANPAHGTLTGTGAARTFTPAANFNGADYFTFKVTDGLLNSNLATVSIIVKAVNDAPVANAQSVTTDMGTAKTITLVATDVDGNALTYLIVANPAHGTLTGIGSVRTYTPAGNYIGVDKFNFKANDGSLNSNIATVSIAVTARIPQIFPGK